MKVTWVISRLSPVSMLVSNRMISSYIWHAFFGSQHAPVYSFVWYLDNITLSYIRTDMAYIMSGTRVCVSPNKWPSLIIFYPTGL